LLLLAPIGVVVIQSAPLAATNTITVNTTSDSSPSGDGLCSLREAINNANSPGTDTTGGDCAIGAVTDVIRFSVSGTITLTSALPAIANASPGSLTIDGTGQTITVDGANSYQILVVNSGATLDLNDLTLAEGSAVYGGAIGNAGTLTLINSTFSGNTGSIGGVIFSTGTLTVTNSTFSGNSASSGNAIGINNDGGTLTVSNSILSASPGGNCSGTIS